MDVNSFSTARIVNSRANVEKIAPAPAKENQYSSRDVRSERRTDIANEGAYAFENQRLEFGNTRPILNLNASSKVYEEIDGSLQRQNLVIDQKSSPSTQAFLDVAEAGSEFHLIDIYV